MKYITIIALITFLNLTARAKEIKTEILINASADKVWAIFTDFDNYPKWNPFIKSISGQIKVGNKIIVKIEPSNSKSTTFKPKVLVFKKNNELRWLGRLLFGGLVDGMHKFELIDNGNGTTTFKQSEIFKGILVPFFGEKTIRKTRSGYEAMNQKLKELAEQK